MEKTYDDAAVERVARWLSDYLGDDPVMFDHGVKWRDEYMEDARKVIALLTPPQEGNQK